jgi:hypothetical protein
MRLRYAAEKATALDPPSASLREATGIKFIASPLASEARFVRHDPEKLSRAIFETFDTHAQKTLADARGAAPPEARGTVPRS